MALEYFIILFVTLLGWLSAHVGFPFRSVNNWSSLFLIYNYIIYKYLMYINPERMRAMERDWQPGGQSQDGHDAACVKRTLLDTERFP